MIQAPKSNEAIIYLGSATVTADEGAAGGFQLYPGESKPFELGSSVMYARSTKTGQKIIVVEFA